MKVIENSSIRIIDSFAYNKSGKIFYRNLSTLRNGDDLNCFVIIKGKYRNGESFKRECKVSFRSYKELSNLSLINIKSSKLQ